METEFLVSGLRTLHTRTDMVMLQGTSHIWPLPTLSGPPWGQLEIKHEYIFIDVWECVYVSTASPDQDQQPVD